MRIPCPHCGERGSEEFRCLGSAVTPRPDPGASAGDWNEYVHLRDNPRGPNAEFWQHVHGCRAWLVVHRDTLSHVVISAAPARAMSRIEKVQP